MAFFSFLGVFRVFSVRERAISHTFWPRNMFFENVIFRTVSRNIVWNFHFWPYLGGGLAYEHLWQETFAAGTVSRSSALCLSFLLFAFSYQDMVHSYKCRFQKSKVVAKVKDCADVEHQSERALKYAVGQIGPVSVAIDANHQSFQFYRGGISLFLLKTRIP